MGLRARLTVAEQAAVARAVEVEVEAQARVQVREVVGALVVVEGPVLERVAERERVVALAGEPALVLALVPEQEQEQEQEQAPDLGADLAPAPDLEADLEPEPVLAAAPVAPVAPVAPAGVAERGLAPGAAPVVARVGPVVRVADPVVVRPGVRQQGGSR